MESVIGTKMQYDPEHLKAFRTGAYALNGPDGPITPADWNDKICPGCVVELRLTGSQRDLELISSRHPKRGLRSPSRTKGSSDAADQPFTPAPPRRVDTDHQIELPGFTAARVLAEHDDCKISEGHGEPIMLQCPERTTTGLIPTPEDNPALCHQSQAPQSSDAHVSSFDKVLDPYGHDTESNPAEKNGQHLGAYQKPVRRATDLQSFVEDVDEESPTEKGSFISMTTIKSPVEDLDLDLCESYDRQSTTSPSDPYQPTRELRDNPLLPRRTSSSHILTMNKEVSSAEADAAEKRFSERDQMSFGSPRPRKTENDSTYMASLEQIVDSNEKPTMSQSSSGTKVFPLCPIFAWNLEATDGLPSTPSENNESIPDQYRDMNRTIRAILEERDAEANMYFLRHKRESDFIDSLPECSRIEFLARMKMIGNAQNRSSDAQYPVKEKPEWVRIQDIISDAMEILDAFVPVHYQKLHQYWLIKKFYGALLQFVTKEVGPFDQESRKQLIKFSVPWSLP